MNRQFKFRIWDKEHKKFVMTGALYGCEGVAGLSTYFNRNTHVVQQFTELHDAKGNEIYEGDVLQFFDEDKGDEPCEVIYELGMFGCNIIDTSNNKDFWQLYYIVTKLKPIVIGNLYEKPPCNFDHNAECLVCDGWPSDCPFVKLSKLEIKSDKPLMTPLNTNYKLDIHDKPSN